MTTFWLNGTPASLEAIETNTTLLPYLRSRGLTGAKEGCAEGDCGACTVVSLERASDGTARYRALASCLVLLPSVAGRAIWTVEALAQPATGDDGLHPVQRALAEHGGSQCGYCTPGMVMSLFAEYYHPRSGDDAVDELLAGNLCRCTGYRPIREAAQALGAPAADDPFRRRLDALAPLPTPLAYEVHGMAFYRPERLEEVLALLAGQPEAVVIAGGTDLVPRITLRHERYRTLVSIEAVPELRAIQVGEGGYDIGAAATLTEIQETLSGAVPLLDALFPLFASRPIRNRATLGGNLATASPIGDASVALLALDAAVRLAQPGSWRTVALADFFTGYRRTVLAPGEVLVSVLVPRPPPAGRRLARFYKVARRSRVDISTVAAAFVVDLDDNDRVQQARLAFGGVAPIPARALAAEEALRGRRWTRRSATIAPPAEVLALLDSAFQPIDDLRASAAYRRALVTGLFERFWEETAQ